MIQGKHQNTDRLLAPDLARATALIGIAVVNVSVIAYPIMSGYPDNALNTAIDSDVYFAIKAFFLMKFYTIFAFMFGVGFAYQLEAVNRRQTKFAPQYFRRMLGLLIFGFINIICLFIGDILVMYSILGSILFLFQNKSTTALLRTGLGFYCVQALIFAAITAFIFSGGQVSSDASSEAVSIPRQSRGL